MINCTASDLLLSTIVDECEDVSENTVIMSAAELNATLEVEAAIAARRDVHTRPTVEMRAVSV